MRHLSINTSNTPGAPHEPRHSIQVTTWSDDDPPFTYVDTVRLSDDDLVEIMRHLVGLHLTHLGLAEAPGTDTGITDHRTPHRNGG